MFLTQLKLSTQDMIDLRITDDYSIHRVVYSLFPEEDKERNRILYVDKGVRKDHRVLWILSQIEPQMKFEKEKMQAKPVSEDFLNHKRYSFEILLNPVRKSKELGKLVPVRAPSKEERENDPQKDDLLDWFRQKAGQNGFAPGPDLRYMVKPVQTFSQKDHKEQTVFHNKVLFSGTLTVTDPECFRQAFEKGIGKAKAFGFGLLQLVPIFD